MEDLTIALFLGQDSARYEHNLNIEMEEGALSWFVWGFFPPGAFSLVYPNYSGAYMAVGGFGGEVKVAAERGKRAHNSKE